jgi:hypothetical protein
MLELVNKPPFFFFNATVAKKQPRIKARFFSGVPASLSRWCQNHAIMSNPKNNHRRCHTGDYIYNYGCCMLPLVLSTTLFFFQLFLCRRNKRSHDISWQTDVIANWAQQLWTHSGLTFVRCWCPNHMLEPVGAALEALKGDGLMAWWVDGWIPQLVFRGSGGMAAQWRASSI